MYSFVNRSLSRFSLRVIATEVPKQCKQTFYERVVTLDDTLDVFTSQLTQKKADKWNNQKLAQKSVNGYLCKNNVENSNSDEELKTYSVEKINQLFQNCIEAGNNSDILNLTKQCIKFRKCPSLSNLNYIFTLCAQNGDKNTVLQITELCEEFHPEITKTNSYFKHYLAEAIWVKGNISEALKIFKEVYSKNVFLRRRIRLVIKYLVQNIVSTRSEAALISIVKFAEEILNTHSDFFPLTCVWQACFLSEWYTDQCLSLQLLERHEGLCKAVISRIPYVVTISLSSHRTDVVYRLLELLLMYEMKLQYSVVLSALLDYQIARGDLRSSTEIVRWSIDNDVQLPTYQNMKFLELLINNKAGSHLLKMMDKRKMEQRSFNRDLKF